MQMAQGQDRGQQHGSADEHEVVREVDGRKGRERQEPVEAGDGQSQQERLALVTLGEDVVVDERRNQDRVPECRDEGVDEPQELDGDEGRDVGELHRGAGPLRRGFRGLLGSCLGPRWPGCAHQPLSREPGTAR